jgi:Uma2 family endonuclease
LRAGDLRQDEPILIERVGYVVKVLIDEEPLTLKDFLCSRYFHEDGWELCKGELVAMSPARAVHDAVVMRIGYLFQSVIGDGSCTVYGQNIGLKLWDDDSFVSPDVSICCDKSIIEDGWFLSVPELVVEVLSKSTKNYCLGEKHDIYRDFGAKEYWVVDPDEKWVLIENFENGLMTRFGMNDVVKSWLFEGFVFEVQDILRVLFC